MEIWQGILLFSTIMLLILWLVNYTDKSGVSKPIEVPSSVRPPVREFCDFYTRNPKEFTTTYKVEHKGAYFTRDGCETVETFEVVDLKNGCVHTLVRLEYTDMRGEVSTNHSSHTILLPSNESIVYSSVEAKYVYDSLVLPSKGRMQKLAELRSKRKQLNKERKGIIVRNKLTSYYT
jgi:hypothetical protein